MSRGRFNEAGRFLSVGAANTLLGLLVIYSAKWFLHLGDIAANAIGYSVGLVLSFVLNCRWTFGYSGPWQPALAKFAVITLSAYGINLLTVIGAISYFAVNSYVAQAMGIVPYTLTTYLASKYIVFRSDI